MGTRRNMRDAVIFTVIHFLLFSSVSTQDCARHCQTNYAPVCGSDGKTYGNECIMKVESCLQSKVITVASNGECQDCNMACQTDYTPVCGSDGKTYANECIMKSEACNQKKTITVASQGACKTECNMVCQTDYRPVCGSDGKTYANECIMKSEACNQKNTITVASQGACKTECNMVCQTDYRPVCGSDGKSYANECIMKSEACNQKKTITVASQGACKATCGKAIDLVFAHDASGSLKEAGFQKIKDFTKDLIDDFEIGIQKTHVGVVVFSHVAKVAIRLDETFDKDILKNKVQNMSYLGYTTATDDALRVSNNDMFSLNGGARQNVPLVLIVLTDGKCTACKEKVSVPAAKLKAKGVKIFGIAVGNKVDIPELQSFVSEPLSDHLLQVESTDKLSTLIKKISTDGCAAKKGKCPAPPTDVTCQEGLESTCYGDAMCDGPQKCCFDGCSNNCAYPLLDCQTPIEIAFALDSSSSIRDVSYRRMKEVVKRVVDSFSVSQNRTRFSVLLYSSDANLEFNLVRYDSASSVKTAIDNLPHMKSGTRIDKALRLAKEKVFSLGGYVRQRRPMVLVVVTDGSTNRGSEDLTIASKPLKDYGVTIIAVGVGPEVNRYELIKFASQPTSENIFTSKNFNDLIPSIYSLTEAVCREKPGNCPAMKAIENCASKVDECKNDFDCYGTSKCCFDGCKKTCRNQLDICRRKVDLTFVIDQSTSVGAKNFEIIKEFVGRTLDHFRISPLDTHVSVISYGTTANIEWTFRDYPGQNIRAAKDSLKALRFSGGASRLDLSVDLANNNIYNEANGMRNNVFKLMVIITDGGFGELSTMRDSFKSLKSKGVNFVALGVGPISELPALKTITQYSGDNNRVFLVKRFEFLSQYAQDIADVACFAPSTVVPSGKIEKGQEKKCGPPKCLKGPKGSRGRQGRAGVQGQSGLEGPPGITGPQGPKGRMGDPGLQASQGKRGDQGMQGLPGHPGINGIPGLPGVEGRPGRPGQCGLKGARGGQGTQGVDGLPGSAGNLGRAGPRGPKGEPAEDILNNIPLIKGIKGSIGDPGFEGPQGPSGQDGSPGPKGQPGDEGDAGEDGLPGERGDPGKVLKKVKGDKGDPGPSGFPGRKGVPKVPGGLLTGLEGPEGLQGPKGNPGDKGNAGESVNIKGEEGSRGLKGPRGSKGERGDSGAEGSKGLPGFPGLIGDVGETGPQGPPGNNGAQGRKGADGSKGAFGLPGDSGEPAYEARKGESGKKGEIGLKGQQGSQGPTGDKGVRGAKGKMGMIGPGSFGDIGDIGPPGPRGDPGRSGVPGMEGTQGLVGAPGNPGPPGNPGANARRIDGTDGMDGPPGRKGDRGPQGDPGITGQKGEASFVDTLCQEGTCPEGVPGDPGPPGVTGPPGDVGPTGPAGSKGFQDQCPTCPAGDQGNVGDYGLPGRPGGEGPPGQRGEPGDDGVVGEPGPQGAIGLNGLSGATGQAGSRGAAGQKGEPADQPIAVKGERGNVGDKGAEGRRGRRGPIGPDGLQGYKGEKGVPGITPARADRGIPGDRGQHAAIGQKGVKGDIGETVFGEKGLKGVRGDRGDDGFRGPRGDDGPKGLPGAGPPKGGASGAQKIGMKGLPGEPGEDGDPGSSPEGARGPTGDKGAKGEPGINAAEPGQRGPPGPPGAVGALGAKGEQGESTQGFAGPAGDRGDEGPKGKRGPQGPPGRKGRAECGSLQSPTDVAFLLDASASLRPENFKKEKFFVKKIINDIFPVSPDGNRIGIIQYSTSAKVEVHFDDYFVNTSLIAAIDDIPYSNGQSRIDLGLKLARDDLFKISKGARQGVRKVLILITDGYQSRADDMVLPQVIAKDLKNQGVAIFAIGSGVEIDWNLLKQVASNENYVLGADNFDQLQNRVQDIQSALRIGCLKQRGQKGEPGLSGEDGRSGRDGDVGRKGMPGTSFGGDVGSRGPKGTKGEQGVGIQGSPGRLGLMGFPGAKGSRGDRGQSGPDGVRGAKGNIGEPAQGPAPRGPKGFPGPAGPKGKSGEKLCKEVLKTDLAFFLDTSASVGLENFKKTKSFIETIVKAFDVSPTNTHVSVATYELETKIEFDFLAYTTQKSLFQAIQDIGYRQGKATYIDSALISADKQVFTPQNKARPGAFKAVILLTDGQQSTRPLGDKVESLEVLAQNLRDKGIRVYVIGIGAEVDQVQLRSMVDVPHHLFLKKDFDALSERIEEELVELNDLGCSGEKGSKGDPGLKGRKGYEGFPGLVGKKGGRGDPGLKGGRGNPGPSSEFTASGRRGVQGEVGVKGLPGLPGCVPTDTNDRPLDLAFLMDASGSLYYDNYDKEKEFVKRIISLQNIGRGFTHVSIISYSENATVHVGFTDYYDKDAITTAVDKIPYEAQNTRIDRALLLAKNNAFSMSKGARPYAKRVAILLTDGQQSVVPGSIDVARAAKLLRDEDVEIFAVGIGPEIDLMQLGEMVSKPSLVFFAADFDRLIREITKEVSLALLCTGGPPGPQGDRGSVGRPGPAGKKGDIGAKGLPGVIGATGRTGLQGDDGEFGSEGPKGNSGSPGDSGEQGDVGFSGFEGFQGEAGGLGSRGVDGDSGRRGDRGPKGFRGIKGAKGEIPENFIPGPGPKGEKGFKGNRGAVGFPGFPGDEDSMPQSLLDSVRKGPQGDIGDAGPRGPPGRNGTFIVPPGPIRQGEKGNIGPRGQKGEVGLKGFVGLAGSQGQEGDVGDAGISGVSGQRGDTGPKGYRGRQGRAGSSNTGPPGGPGFTGLQGPRGEKGKRGEPGVMGINGATGDPGEKGLKGFQADPDSGLKGLKGYQGNHGPRGPRGPKGPKGETLRGEKGAVGEEGPVGSKGERGGVGPIGPKGFAGFRGIQGIQGPDGEDGNPGTEGVSGLKGEMGEIIFNGENKGEMGDIGDTGPDGRRGDEGPMGPIGSIGIRGAQGKQGERGKDGLPGLPGVRGPDGETGPIGFQGFPGPLGDPGDDGPEGPKSVADGFYVVRHSQTDRVPDCPFGFKKLWDGYSWVYSVGNGMAHGQDLANAGSCVRSFSTMPFLFCETNPAKCSYSSRNDFMYWLSARNTMLMNPVTTSAVSPFISRCAVCETPAVHIAVHSQDTSQPDCPVGWSSLWSGYSFLMMTGSGGTGTGESLTSSGSCLEDFRPNPFIECQGARGTCNFFSDKFSFWLTTVDAQTQFQAQQSETLHQDKGHNLKSKISRCRVCTKGFVNNLLGGPRNSTRNIIARH